MKQPNLIYIFADQWRRHAISSYNQDPVITPNFDEFIRESAHTKHAISCCPLCSPHRSSLLTGRYPLETGVWTNCKVGLDVELDTSIKSIADYLNDAGYKTGYIGKWHLDLPELNKSPVPLSGAQGWDAFTPPGRGRMGFEYWYSYGAMDNHLSPHYWEDSHEKIHINQWSPQHETDKAIDFIHRQKSPFALFVSWNPPHNPYDVVPDKYRSLYDKDKIKLRDNVLYNSIGHHTDPKEATSQDELLTMTRDYYAAVTGIDEQFGRILSTLEVLDIDENTIVVVSSDHGDMMGSHGLIGKHVWYEEAINIPWMIRWPCKINPGEFSGVINSVDQMPTLLSLMDVPFDPVSGMDCSDNLLELSPSRHSAFIHAYPGRAAVVKSFKEKGLNNLSYGWRGVRNQRYTLVADRGYKPVEVKTEYFYYDLISDPLQVSPMKYQKNESEILDEMYSELMSYLESTNDPFVVHMS
ncbi:sulfatase [Acidaminobacter sp. JC074]|uniref:sulfatase family protein n=1 Tax=Acidaminobacter sp. JC074 TaxID=2530199 RepID=UPI001F101636|nr:sulfatase [Acidaminobacter sp. JC074]MCH4886188.1 sulfatase [Acidaminobacter sp. JC074]